MLPKRLLHHLRLLLTLILGLTIGAVIGGIYYINQTGMNTQWRAKIAYELENIGIIADFDSLRIDLARGLVASGVRIYADDSRQDIIANLEHLVIDVDKTKLIRGNLRVNKVSLKKADISLPVDPNDPEGPRIIMNDLQGDMVLPDKNTVVARNISGSVAGIHLELDARIWNNHSNKKEPEPEDKDQANKVKAIANIIKEIAHWQWPQNSPPHLRIYLEGNIDSPDSARLDFTLSATELERDGIILNDVEIIGDYKNKVVTLDSIKLGDGAGSIAAQADFHTITRSGRFSADSSLHIQRLARKVFGVGILQQITFSTPPQIQCTGLIQLDEGHKPHIQVTGHAQTKDFSCLGTRYTQMDTNFSAQGMDVFLTNLHIKHATGALTGRVLMKNDTIRYESDSTLPAESYLTFIKDTPIAKVLDKANFDKDATIHITAKGTMNRSDLTDWAATGTAKFTNFSYKDVPIHSLNGYYEMSSLLSKFTDIKAHIDYTDYSLRKRHGGPNSARVNVDSMTLDRTDNTFEISNIRSTAWPAPIVKLFHTNVAKHIESYRFHRPPSLVGNGIFGLRKDDSRTNFKIDFSTTGNTHYDFLGKPLTLQRAKGKVRIKKGLVEVTDLSFNTFAGSSKGYITVRTNTKNTPYSGAFQWSRLHFNEIGKLYEFNKTERGLLTGRLDFSGEAKNMRRFNGKGDLALERGNLFSVPMLGPLSPLISTVLGKRNPAQQLAEDASATFIIKNGVIYSNDFLATTHSLKFTGEGKIDLHTKNIDLLFRMNARGLFSFFSLPIRPLIGLFQFQGKGYVMDPKWNTVIFTTPNRGKNDPIFRKPPKAKVIRE